jgi:flavin reductase (DIM6/NTAB) family NADH-FMN oxidoreductase RutF
MNRLIQWIAKLSDKSFHSFQAVRIADGGIKERFYLKKSEHQIEFSQAHAVVSHAPFCLAVAMSPEQCLHFEKGSSEACILIGDQLCARLEVSAVNKIEQGSSHILIFRVDKADNCQINFIRQAFLFRLLKTKNSRFEDRCYAAAFSYPRSVIVVSFRHGDYYNIFPMDFQCFLDAQGFCILGLRVTNVTLHKMLAVRKVVVGDTSDVSRDMLYALGKHHSTHPPFLNELPFKTTDSERFGFPVPDFSASYREIELVAEYRAGTHVVMIGKIVNVVKRREQQSPIHHIHFFHALVSAYISA